MPRFEPPDDSVEKARKYSEGSPLGTVVFLAGWALAVAGCAAGTNLGGDHPLVFVCFLLAVGGVVAGRWLMLRGQQRTKR